MKTLNIQTISRKFCRWEWDRGQLSETKIEKKKKMEIEIKDHLLQNLSQRTTVDKLAFVVGEKFTNSSWHKKKKFSTR